jgi:hypothetical protein
VGWDSSVGKATRYGLGIECRSQWPRGLRRRLACWNCGFESRRRHGCFCCVVLCCVVLCCVVLCCTVRTKGKCQGNQDKEAQIKNKDKTKNIPVFARFPAPVQTGPLGPPSLLYNEYRISFPGVKLPGRGVNHPPHLAPRLKKE